MKTKLFFRIAAALTAVSQLYSCSIELDSPELTEEPQVEEVGVTYHDVLIIASESADTKTYLESDGDGGYISKWEENDQVAIFQKNSIDGYRTKITSKKPTLSDSDCTAAFGASLAEVDGAVDYKYWAVYPDGVATRSSDDLNLTIPGTQSFKADKFDKAADVMISEPVERAAFSSADLSMGFGRVGAIVKMTLKGLTEGETLKSVTLSTTEDGKYLAGVVKYDLTNDELKEGITSGKQTLTLDAGESIVVPASGNVDVWFRCAEVTLANNFTVKAYTRDAGMQNYSYTRTVDLAAASRTLSFNNSVLTTFGVTGLSAGKETLEYEPLIPEGYYVIHVVNTASDYDKAISNVGSGYLEAVDNPFSPDANSKYNTTTNPELLWRVDFDEENNKYAFYSPENEKYISGTDGITANGGSATWYYMGENSGDYAGTYSIYNGVSFASANHIGYNSGASPKRFKFYAAPITNFPGYLTFTPAYSAPVVTYSNVVLSTNEEVADPVSIFPTSLIFAEDIEVVGVYSDALCTVAADWFDADMAVAATGEIRYLAEENTTSSPRTAYVKVYALGENALEAEVVFSITQPGAIGDASNGDTLWAEAFSGFSANDVPSASNANTTVYGDRSVSYSCTGTGKIYAQNNAGGTSPELLISASGGTFTVTGIPTGNATGMTLTFKSNNGCTVSSTTTSASITDIGSYTYGITVPSGTKTLNLTFTKSTSGNTRVDDFLLVAGAPVPGITVATSAATATSSATGTTATLNGSLTLVNGAVNASVTDAGFYYKLTSAGAYTKVTCASAPTSTTTFSYDLTGLTKDSEYTYYAYAVYDDGDEVTGSTTTFTPEQSGGGGGSTWTLVTDASTLKAGDVIVFAAYNVSYKVSGTTYYDNKVMGEISAQLGTAIDVTFGAGGTTIPTLPITAQQYTLGGTSGAWTIMNGTKYLTQGDKKITEGDGSHTWTISISDGNATVTSVTASTYKLQYNPNSGNGRFATYSSAQKAIRIYRYE